MCNKLDSVQTSIEKMEASSNDKQKIKNFQQESLVSDEIKSNQTQVSTNLNSKNKLLKNINGKKISEINPFYSYIPIFYLKELKRAKFNFIFYLIVFSVIVILSSTLLSLSFNNESLDINPWMCFFFLPPGLFFLVELIISWNIHKNFTNEAKTINFRDSTVLSMNVQKLYKRMKTSYIDINWFSLFLYVGIGITLLVDAIWTAFEYHEFGGFIKAWKDGNRVHLILNVVCFFSLIVICCFQIYKITSNFLRACNIENFYNFSIIDQNELQMNKKNKNKRDALIFFMIFGLFFFLIWLLIKFINNRRSPTKVIVK